MTDCVQLSSSCCCCFCCYVWFENLKSAIIVPAHQLSPVQTTVVQLVYKTSVRDKTLQSLHTFISTPVRMLLVDLSSVFSTILPNKLVNEVTA